MGDWAVLFRPTARLILETLLPGPRSLSELSSHTGLTKPALQRHLKDLERLGVIGHSYHPVGMSREVVYEHKGCTLHVEMRPRAPDAPLGGTVLSWASAGFVPPDLPLTAQLARAEDRRDIAEILIDLREKLPEAYDALVVIVFGSVARGEATRKSDLDLLVVLPDDGRDLKERVADRLAHVQARVQRPIQPFYTRRSEFLLGRRGVDEAAAREGIIVHGSWRERDVWTRMRRYGNISV